MLEKKRYVGLFRMRLTTFTPLKIRRLPTTKRLYNVGVKRNLVVDETTSLRNVCRDFSDKDAGRRPKALRTTDDLFGHMIQDLDDIFL